MWRFRPLVDPARWGSGWRGLSRAELLGGVVAESGEVVDVAVGVTWVTWVPLGGGVVQVLADLVGMPWVWAKEARRGADPLLPLLRRQGRHDPGEVAAEPFRGVGRRRRGGRRRHGRPSDLRRRELRSLTVRARLFAHVTLRVPHARRRRLPGERASLPGSRLLGVARRVDGIVLIQPRSGCALMTTE